MKNLMKRHKKYTKPFFLQKQRFALLFAVNQLVYEI